jgi:DNA polymerase III delta prime subunit
MVFEFPRTLGQEDAQAKLRQTLSQERFPHALLIHGEPGLGQHALLLDLAQILACEHKDQRPCGGCFSCRAFEAASLDSLHYLIPLAKKDKDGGDWEGGLEAAQIEELSERIRAWHATPYGLEAAEKALVRVPQARELISRLSYSGQTGRARIVLVPYLESLNVEAANALLKTLEEPPANVYFLIGSENRAALLPTLLSRCLHLGLAPLAPDAFRVAADTLSRRAGLDTAPRLLPFAEGSPGVYLELLRDDGEELLEESLKFLSAAAASDWRVFADYVSQGPASEGLEETVRLLHFLLRLLRVHQSLRARHGGSPEGLRGAEDGYRWTARALELEGWDASLAPYLGPFEEMADLAAFAGWIEAAHHAVKGYSKPSVALLGLYLEYEAKSRRAAPSRARAAA